MTCCGRNNGKCVCASEATCSCGQKPALECSCAKASTENKVPSNTCACGKRAEGSCTCGRSDGNAAAASENEVDFTTKK